VDARNQRLACLIAVSVILHAAALAPLKARHSPSRPSSAPPLTVGLFFPQKPAAAPSVPIAAVASRVAPEATPPQPAAIPGAQPQATAQSRPDRADSAQAAPTPQPAPAPDDPVAQPQPAPIASGEAESGVRLAVADEVSVRVEMLSYEGGLKPKDTLQFEGQTYYYFKSPDLRRPTQPLEDIHPHYPSNKPYYPNGAVKLQLLIDEQGRLEHANVLCSNPDFEKSALASIEHLRFTPAQTVAGPVSSYMVVEFGYGSGYPCQPVPDIRPSR
jgi:outer membrane biosynthesis protein TonB